MADPMHQFQVQKIMDLPDFSLPFVGRVDMAVTNATVAMAISFALVVLFFTISTARVAVVPGRMQVIGESVFGFIDDLAVSIIGHEGRKFFPYVFTLFTFILAMNMLGLFLMFGPHTVLLTMDVQFREGLSGSERDAAVQRLEKVIGDKHKDINHIFIESGSLSGNRRENENR